MADVPPTNGIMVPVANPSVPAENVQHPLVSDADGKLHNPLDEEAFYSPEHLKERQERQARRDVLKQYRAPIGDLPVNHCWEIPGR